MRLINKPQKPPTTLGIGVFDGMHIGHQDIAKQCDSLLSFYPHPDSLLKKIDRPQYLTTLRERLALCPTMAILHFTPTIRHLSPLDFLNHVILEHFAPKRIVVGYDFQFGFKKQGTLDTLKTWGKEHSIDIAILDKVCQNGTAVKSGLIRQQLQNNQFQDAVKALGHPYPLFGRVIKGEGRGKSLGFPTANLYIPKSKLIPANGVYQGVVSLNQLKTPCILYIGSKPTFNGHTTSVEVHLLDTSSNLYGQCLRVGLTRKIRDERRFTSKEALINQIKTDIATCRP